MNITAARTIPAKMKARLITSAAFSPNVHGGGRRLRTTTPLLLWLRSTGCLASRRSRSLGSTVAPSTSGLPLVDILYLWTGARCTGDGFLVALEDKSRGRGVELLRKDSPALIIGTEQVITKRCGPATMYRSPYTHLTQREEARRTGDGNLKALTSTLEA